MKRTLFIISLIATAAFSQDKDICADVIAASRDAAEPQARVNIAININSMIDYSSKRVTKAKDNGEGSRKILTKDSIQSAMKNANAVKFTGAKGNSYTFCVSREDAAKPYVVLQKSLMRELEIAANKAKIGAKEYEDIGKIYDGLGAVWLILNPLGYMDRALEKEYEDAYERAKAKYNEYAAQAGKGVYVESNHKELKSKVGSHIAKSGCAIAESAESAAMVLKMDYVECEKKDMPHGAFSCKVCAEASLQSAKTGKSLYENIVSHKEIWTNSMEEACAEALKPLPDKIWEEIKKPIIKGECK